MHAVLSEGTSFAVRPAPLAARVRPIARHQLSREQLRVAEELVRLGHLRKTAEERKRRDRMFRLTRQGHAWLYDHGLDDGPRRREVLRTP